MQFKQNSSDHENTHVTDGNASDKYTEIIVGIKRSVNAHMQPLLRQMLSVTAAKLQQYIQANKTNAESRNTEKQIRLVHKKLQHINQLYISGLNRALTATQTRPERVDDESPLVDQDEMDELVAITTMYSKAMNIYGDEVKHLKARLEYLEIVCEEVFDKEALDPRQLCEVFQQTIQDCGFSIKVKLLLYRFFDREVCAKLEPMYQELNRIFISHNVMPEIVLNTADTIDLDYAENNARTRVASYYDPEENREIHFIPRSKEDISRIVNDFMSGEVTITGDEIDLPESFLQEPTRQDLEGRNCYKRTEVLRALSGLQRKLTSLQNKTRNFTSQEIKQDLLDNISKSHVGDTDKRVNILDERSMDFVGLMFDAIANDDTISDIITNLINRLQIPVMKVAMTDNSIFDMENHPARMTVDLLGSAGKGINNRQDKLYNELATIVDDILNQFDDDLSIFEHAASRLQAIIVREKQLTDQTEKQQQQHILQAHARNMVSTQLKIASANRVLPDRIRPLIMKNWASLMLNRYLKYGRGSTPWLQSVMLLKLLFKCIQPIQAQSQYNYLKGHHEKLVSEVSKHLYETRQDKEDVDQQIATLDSWFSRIIEDYHSDDHLHETVIDRIDESSGEKATASQSATEMATESSSRPDSEQASSKAADEDNAELHEIQQQEQSARQKIAQLPDNTKPGVWYEIYTDEQRAPRRLKLSVILTEEAKLIFVDRKGIQVIEKDAAIFAQELQDNRSRVIADHSTFAYALGKVIGTISV